jgi:CRISPR-associated protein Cmr4
MGLQATTLQFQNEPQVKLFFNLGFLRLQRATAETQRLLEKFLPPPIRDDVPVEQLVVVDDASMGSIHDMALYRQSRVKLSDEKLVQFFFNMEALPEGSVLSFPIAVNEPARPDELLNSWVPFKQANQIVADSGELYFGGLESIGFGRCQVNIMEFGA